MMNSAALFILWFSVWIAMSWPPSAKDLICAAAVSVLVSIMTLDMFKESPASGARRLGPLAVISRCLWICLYAVIFLWECVKANLDVAYRVIHPALPIRPGTIKVKVALKSDIGLTLLANSVTLTPGTTSIDIDKERGFLYIHQLYVSHTPGSMPVVERFERILKRIFE